MNDWFKCGEINGVVLIVFECSFSWNISVYSTVSVSNG